MFTASPSCARSIRPFLFLPNDTRNANLSLKLQVIHCSGLAKADRFGLPDPFCIVKWQGVELGRTPTVYNTVHPVWKNCGFELPLRAPPQQDVAGKHTVPDVLGFKPVLVELCRRYDAPCSVNQRVSEHLDSALLPNDYLCRTGVRLRHTRRRRR